MNWTRRGYPFLVSLCLLIAVGPSVTQAEPASRASRAASGSAAAGMRPSWGTTSRVQYHVGPFEFEPTLSTRFFHSAEDHFGIWTDSGDLYAHPHLPAGALLQRLELDYCDNGTGSVSLNLYDCDYLGGDCNPLMGLSSNAGASGCGFIDADLATLNYTFDNNLRQLLLYAVTTGGNQTILLGAYIGYKLQVSPAPLTATFGDVPTSHPYFRFIEALYDAGITAGCGAGNYCPGNAITRGEMAVFLAKALGLHFPN